MDAYIDRAAEFARPILGRLRERVHDACPDAEEAIKWGMPSFTYRGRILCSMAAFKQHASFGFWQHAQVMGEDVVREGMGSLGRLTDVASIPPVRTLKPLLRKAMALIDGGPPTVPVRSSSAPKPALEPPADLLAALRRNAAARRTFEGFAPSHRREYIEWLMEAKREDTRARRLAQAIEWLAEGKARHWKYQRG